MGGEGVTQHVRAFLPRGGRFQSLMHHTVDEHRIDRTPLCGHKQRRLRPYRTDFRLPDSHIGQQTVAEIRHEGEHTLLVALAENPHLQPSEIEIAQTERGQFALPQPQGIEGLHYHGVAHRFKGILLRLHALHKTLHLRLRHERREPLRHFRGDDFLHRVGRQAALPLQKTVERFEG